VVQCHQQRRQGQAAGDLVKESDDVQIVRLQGQEETETQEVGEIESFSPENARPGAFSFPALGALTSSAVAANN
jgi:hypothetical protein